MAQTMGTARGWCFRGKSRIPKSSSQILRAAGDAWSDSSPASCWSGSLLLIAISRSSSKEPSWSSDEGTGKGGVAISPSESSPFVVCSDFRSSAFTSYRWAGTQQLIRTYHFSRYDDIPNENTEHNLTMVTWFLWKQCISVFRLSTSVIPLVLVWTRVGLLSPSSSDWPSCLRLWLS